MTDSDILTAADGPAGHLTLNRPRALHALTTDMCASMAAALGDWARDRDIRVVLLDHSGERGFCAGGDVRAAAASGAADGALARDFFRTEYRLNHLMFTYAKPIVAVMDGVTMGGGVGISAPASVRIATERTVWAMPEMAIGLFPDVGAGWYLPRLPGQAGVWLGLTGARLKAADLCALGLATHYVPSDRLAELKARLLQSGDASRIDTFAADPGPGPLVERRGDIDRLFAHDTVEAIFAALADDGSEWARAQQDAMNGACPTALKVALRQMRQGAQAAVFAEEMATEYRLALRMTARPDFAEGVRAVLVDKDNCPVWRPASIQAVSAADVDAIFAPLPAVERWSPSP